MRERALCFPPPAPAERGPARGEGPSGPAGKSRRVPAVPAPAPLCHGGRAALGPAGDLPAGRCAQGAGEGAPPGERGLGAGKGERGGGGGGSALTRRVCGAASVSAVLSSEV